MFNHLLSQTIVKSLAPPERGNRVSYDRDLKGFGVRVTAAGAKAFVLNYRCDRREHRFTIGAFPAWSTTAARERAKELRREIDKGHCPMCDRAAERKAPTVADLAERFAEEFLSRKAAHSQNRERAMLDNDILPALGHLKVAEVRYSDIYNLHRKITRRGPVRANRILALCSRLFSLAVRPWEYRPDNPCRGVERNPENRRERYLSTAEISRLSEALDWYARNANPIAANAIRFCLLTGARSGEVMGATWGEFDLEVGTWTKAAATTKQRKLHRVPLSAPALELLQAIAAGPKADPVFVFPGRKPGEPIKQLRSCWDSVTKRAGIEDARIHDLRHSFASVLVSGGASLPLIGQLLGHTQPVTTARYAHLYDDPLREAVERVGQVVTAAGKGEGAEVVPLRKGGQ